MQRQLRMRSLGSGFIAFVALWAAVAQAGAVLDTYSTGFEASEGYVGVTAADTSTTGMITNHTDWSGGAQAGITNDNPDWGVNADGSYGDEKVINYDAYTGDQCFRLDREYGSSGQGSLFGPVMATSMPPAGQVRVSFAFKPVSSAADDSWMSVQSGAAAGNDKADHLAFVGFDSTNGLCVGNYDAGNGGNLTFAATSLTPTVWHTVEATLTYGGGWTTGVPGSLVGYDTCSISVDGGAAVSFSLDGTNMWRYGFSSAAWAYQSHDRVKFQCLNGWSAGSIDTQSFDHSGFYFDDLTYELLEADAADVPEPISMIFFGTGVVGIAGFVARRRMRRAVS